MSGTSANRAEYVRAGRRLSETLSRGRLGLGQRSAGALDLPRPVCLDVILPHKDPVLLSGCKLHLHCRPCVQVLDNKICPICSKAVPAPCYSTEPKRACASFVLELAGSVPRGMRQYHGNFGLGSALHKMRSPKMPNLCGCCKATDDDGLVRWIFAFAIPKEHLDDFCPWRHVDIGCWRELMPWSHQKAWRLPTSTFRGH